MTLPSSRLHCHNSELFRPQPVDVNTVILTIKELENTNTCGSDDITFRFLRDALPVITPHLRCIINTSIVTGVFPTARKHSLVTLIYKTSAADDPGNYRPISLLSIVSKILEKIIATQLVNFLEYEQLICSTQHGFRPNFSTVTALTKITHNIHENMNNKRISLLTLCDLSKAFVSVSHEIVLKNMYNMRIDSFLFKDYLARQNTIGSYWRHCVLEVACAIWCSPRIHFRPHIVHHIMSMTSQGM